MDATQILKSCSPLSRGRVLSLSISLFLARRQVDVPEEQLRLLHVGLLLRRRGPSRAAGWSAGDRELLLGQVEPAVVLEAELLLDGLKGRENSIQLVSLICKSECKIKGYLRDERLPDARLDGEQEI